MSALGGKPTLGIVDLHSFAEPEPSNLRPIFVLDADGCCEIQRAVPDALTHHAPRTLGCVDQRGFNIGQLGAFIVGRLALLVANGEIEPRHEVPNVQQGKYFQ